MATASTGLIIGGIILLFVVIIGIILLVVFFSGTINKNKNPAGFPITTSNRNENIAEFRPIKLSKCDLRRFCDDPSSCDISECSSSSESHSSSCSNKSSSSCNSCVSLPCALKGKCKEPETISVSGSTDTCSESSGSQLWSCSNSCSTCDRSSDTCHHNPCRNNPCSSSPCSDSLLCNKPNCSDSCSDSMRLNMNQQDFFSALDLKVICFHNLQPNQIKDITDNGTTAFALKKFNTTKIVMKKCKSGAQCEITSKISLDRIIWFSGTMFAVSGGTLFQRDPSSVGTKLWFWFTVQNAPTGITWITKTIDGKYLWLQTSDKGFLFNCNRKLVDTLDIQSTIQRSFGRTVNTVGDLDTANHQLFLVGCNKKFSNIGLFTFNFQNEVIFIRPAQLDVVSGIRLIFFRPYYLLK